MALWSSAARRRRAWHQGPMPSIAASAKLRVHEQRRPTQGCKPPVGHEMVWVPAGTFLMGSDRHYPEEAPAHQVHGGRLLDRPHAGDQPRVPPLRRGDRPRDASPSSRPTRRTIPARCPHMLQAGSLVFTPPGRRSTCDDFAELVAVHVRRQLAPPARAAQLDRRARRPPGGARRLRGRRGLRGVGRQGAADRGGMGVRRARRARRRRVRLGRRVHARRPAHGQHLAGRVPQREPARSTATRARRRSARSRPTATASTT